MDGECRVCQTDRFSQLLSGSGGGDEIVIYRVGGPLLIIVWDIEA